LARIIVDTSAIYALLDRSDANHAKAVELLKKMREERRLVTLTNFIVAEAHALLLARLGHGLARTWLKNLRWPVEMVVAADEERAKEIIFTYEDKTFSYTDATTFAVMERTGIKTAFAFDNHFLQFGFTLYM